MRLKRFRLSTAALAAGIVLAAPLAVRAQSLQELYFAAHAYDATYLAAKALADSAQYRVEQVEALARPSAGLSGSALRNEVDYPTIGSGGSNSAGATVSARYPLFNRDNSVAIDQARRSLDSAKADLEIAEQDLIVRVAQAYFDTLAAEDTLSTARTSKAAITEQLASAKRNFEVGTATITDTREAQARYDLATALDLQAENQLNTRRIALDTLVGRSNVKPNPLIVPVVLPPPLPADPNVWVSTAEAIHPAIQRAQVAYDIAQLEIDRARAAGMPTVDAVGSAGITRNTGFAVSLPGNQKVASVGVQLAWPLYTGGAVQSRVKETLVLQDKARSDLEATRRQVEQGTRTAFYTVLSLMSQVTALEAAEASSKLALEATQLGYRVGVRVNLDVLNAQTQLFTTQRDLSRARYDVLYGSLLLRRASGQLGPGDVEAMNRLIVP